MSLQNTIYVIGSSNTDMVIKTPKLPMPGETVLGGDFLMNAGGKGANQAVAAARLGGKVVFVAKVGDDIFGKQALQQFTKEKINIQYIKTDPHHPSGVALINVDAKGENCISVASGANGFLSEADITPVFEEMRPNDILLVQLEIQLSTVAYAIQKAHEKGVRIILNPAPMTALPNEIWEHLYLITPNETETQLLTGMQVNDEVSAKAASKQLIDKGIANVIITLGAKGAYLHTQSAAKQLPAPIVKAIDTTAAGDCFNGALVVALAEGNSLEEAVIFATKAASIAVTRMGAQASMPYRHELDELL